MLGHELRNPLAAIRNTVELFKLTNSDDPQVAQFRDIVDRQTRNQMRIVDDLLQISRISQGKIHLRTEPMELSAVVAHAVQESQSLSEQTEHNVRCEFPDTSPWVLADPARISQVLINLFNNARQFTPTGGDIWISVLTEGDDAVISVRDSGIGIAVEHASKVFEPFYQGEQISGGIYKGMGIGLALTKSLVVLHGGSIVAKSAGSNQGSEFIVRLPLIAQPDVPAAYRSAVVSGLISALKILVVDDESDGARSLAMILRTLGHEVQVEADGEAGLATARSFQPDVALLDIAMPIVNGYQLAQQIRAESWGEKMLLIAQTGLGQDSDKLNARKAGFNYHLTKPIEVTRLQELLAQVYKQP